MSCVWNLINTNRTKMDSSVKADERLRVDNKYLVARHVHTLVCGLVTFSYVSGRCSDFDPQGQTRLGGTAESRSQDVEVTTSTFVSLSWTGCTRLSPKVVLRGSGWVWVRTRRGKGQTEFSGCRRIASTVNQAEVKQMTMKLQWLTLVAFRPIL